MNGGALVGKGAIYLVYDNVKYHIANPTVFNGCGFDWSKIKSDSASLADLNASKLGPKIM